MSSLPRISFITLGCAKNEVDTDKMQARLREAGFPLVDDLSQADLAIVNTCAFLSSAVEESLEVIFDLSSRRESKEGKLKILVAGCMPSRYGDALSDELDEASGFLEAGQEDNIVETVESLFGIRSAKGSAATFAARYESGVSRYVKISDGCDRFCSYCMIPYIRGRYHSYELEDIDAEVSELVDKGAREIVLIGQDTGIWGRDLDVPSTTSQLLEVLSDRHPDTWFRLMYVQPEGIDDELLNVIASRENVCSYLDMPLQHCNAEVLARMNRSGDAPSYLELVAHVRDLVPDIKVRTTLMTGFPGETVEHFEELLDFVEQAQFDYAAVFPYSPEEGSAAYSFDGLLDEDERIERAQTLLDVCESIGTARLADGIPGSAKVLVEGYEMTDVGLEALCRTAGQAPEVDGQVHVPLRHEDELPVGQFAHIAITGSFFYEIEGELIDHE